MTRHPGMMIGTTLVAAAAAAALLAANDPGAFTGSGSPWIIAAKAVLYFVAMLAAILFSANGGFNDGR